MENYLEFMKDNIRPIIFGLLAFSLGIGYIAGYDVGYTKAKKETPNLEVKCNQFIKQEQNPSFELTGVKMNNDGSDTSSLINDQEYDRLERAGIIIQNSLSVRCMDNIQLNRTDYSIWCNKNGTIYLLPVDVIKK